MVSVRRGNDIRMLREFREATTEAFSDRLQTAMRTEDRSAEPSPGMSDLLHEDLEDSFSAK
jgi:hypothetical protein